MRSPCGVTSAAKATLSGRSRSRSRLTRWAYQPRTTSPASGPSTAAGRLARHCAAVRLSAAATRRTRGPERSNTPPSRKRTVPTVTRVESVSGAPTTECSPEIATISALAY